MTNEFARVLLIEVAIFAAPVAAIVASGAKKKRDAAQLLILTAVAALPGLVFDFTSWACRGEIATSFFESLTYVVAIYLVFSLITQIQIRWVCWLLRGVACLPVLMGLLLGTVGILGLMFIVSDGTPQTIQQVAPHYAVEVRQTGNAVSNTDTAEVTVVHYIPILPLKRSIWHKSYDIRLYSIVNGPFVSVAVGHRSVTIAMNKLQGGADQDIVPLR